MTCKQHTIAVYYWQATLSLDTMRMEIRFCLSLLPDKYFSLGTVRGRGRSLVMGRRITKGWAGKIAWPPGEEGGAHSAAKNDQQNSAIHG